MNRSRLRRLWSSGEQGRRSEREFASERCLKTAREQAISASWCSVLTLERHSSTDDHRAAAGFRIREDEVQHGSTARGGRCTSRMFVRNCSRPSSGDVNAHGQDIYWTVKIGHES